MREMGTKRLSEEEEIGRWNRLPNRSGRHFGGSGRSERSPQSEMEEAGMSHRYYRKIETGRADITIGTLVRVMGARGSE